MRDFLIGAGVGSVVTWQVYGRLLPGFLGRIHAWEQRSRIGQYKRRRRSR